MIRITHEEYSQYMFLLEMDIKRIRWDYHERPEELRASYKRRHAPEQLEKFEKWVELNEQLKKVGKMNFTKTRERQLEKLLLIPRDLAS